MVRFVGAIANDGEAVDLRLRARTGITSILPVRSNRIMQSHTASLLSDMMAHHSEDRFPGLRMHAKSGTAEVGRDSRPHAWFTGFITNRGNPLAFAVIVENGGGGTAVAAPIANTVLQAALNRDE